ncbi:hypothetical protein D2N39_21940 [Gemmobacter lutimaris]|uniref:Phage tail assembly protein n=1 Tax=Gemmobacter lutimaris TaxID=2306023 RepID=A0A398BME4_9RHOB|nr:hypothetical protein [Gemmobacter lutimaris]RID89678.1 hypothetical protein D2N39_21940 [Gemmobacter lutimaris]
MFKLLQKPEFSHTVKLSVPVDGGHDTQTFTARFRALPVSEVTAHDTMTAEGTATYLREILTGWEGVVDDAGEEIAFNDATRDRMIDLPFVRVALLETYNAAMLGAKRGN